MSEAGLHALLTGSEFVLAAVTVIALVFVSAPYGRHTRSGWGPSVPNRVGWVVMELPATVWFAAVFLQGDRATEAVPLLLLGMWQIHYLHRTFVFPFRLRTTGKRIALVVVALGFAFNMLNGYVNARWISHLGSYDTGWLTDPRLAVGGVVFAIGMAINVRADTMLIHLRHRGETGYRIPRGWLFERVSCPNYLGEIIEWTGWAIASWSMPGLAFAVYTAANVGPRALANHRWYRRTFPEYPPDRKALLPYLL